MVLKPLTEMLVEQVALRVLSDGGFVDQIGGQFRVDATAWATIAFASRKHCHCETHRARLGYEQGDDGRVPLSRDHADSYWPTALAILAWQGSPASQTTQNRAVQFLLGTSGTHFAKRADAPSAHDTQLKGWPWIEETHSWVEPTAYCVMALRAAGYGQHDRVGEAIRMILDRQLPHGGWNAGNTVVFGRELHPMPEGTGAALASLAGEVNEREIVRSLDYLQGEVDRLGTPISLGWALLGLAAWDRQPSNGAALVERCCANQTRYGPYDTSALCLLLLGALTIEVGAILPLFSHAISKRNSAVLIQ